MLHQSGATKKTGEKQFVHAQRLIIADLFKKRGLDLTSEGGKYCVRYSEVLSPYGHIPSLFVGLVKSHRR